MHFSTAPLAGLVAAVLSLVLSVSVHAATAPSPVRGVNIGGWLVVEKWLGGDIWDIEGCDDAVDEWTLAAALGDGAPSAFAAHWEAFFNQSIVSKMALAGVNALRIPVGYWSVTNVSDSTPYVFGGIDYLDTAIEWARDEGMVVWIDLHGAPGSQNGYDNSGHEGAIEWQSDSSNLQSTIDVLVSLAEKYSSSEYSDVVYALELVNEPAYWSPNNINVTRQFYADAYYALSSYTSDLQIVLHDSFQDLSDWADFPSDIGNPSYGSVALDTHYYQVYNSDELTYNGAKHIVTTCEYSSTMAASNDIMPTYAGEFSAAMNVCILANGTSVAGTSCDEEGCQCTSDSTSEWSSVLVNLVRGYVEAQLDVFENAGSGYFFWAHIGPGAWSFLNGLDEGWIPYPLTDRAYPGQCKNYLNSTIETSKLRRDVSSSVRRTPRGLLGL
ncbi:glycoside hydrolase superfamily [Limtongia smithiae]|uniref:glycoside hydrolase superfamily n=1 Tax=Limtongia smithiae TaxID=1125753 RepID=UPI0034CFFEAD